MPRNPKWAPQRTDNKLKKKRKEKLLLLFIIIIILYQRKWIMYLIHPIGSCFFNVDKHEARNGTRGTL